MDYRSYVVLEQKMKVNDSDAEVVFKLHLPHGVSWESCREMLKVFEEGINALESHQRELNKQAEELPEKASDGIDNS